MAHGSSHHHWNQLGLWALPRALPRLLKDGVFVTTQNHWSFSTHGLVHLELFLGPSGR